MNYSPNTIGNYLKWYEIMADISIWDTLFKNGNMSPTTIPTLKKICEIFSSLKFLKPYKTHIKDIGTNIGELQDVLDIHKAGFINLFKDDKNEVIIISPPFIEITKVIKPSKKPLNFSLEAEELYSMFCDVQKKYLKMKHRAADWKKELQNMLKSVPFSHISEIISTLPNMKFWNDKILSPKALRKHYNQLDRELHIIKKTTKKHDSVNLNVL